MHLLKFMYVKSIELGTFLDDGSVLISVKNASNNKPQI